jgi:hypothetical protein
MAPYAVEVTMATSWKGISEEFSNLFHYNTPVITTEGGWAALANAVVAELKPIHSSVVTFKRVRIYGPTDGPKEENQMRYVADLSGAGTLAGSVFLNPELAVVGWVYVGRGPKGGKQILRKFLHTAQLPTGAAGNAALGTAPLTSTDKAPFITRLNNLKTLTIGGADNQICTPNGKGLPLGSNWAVLDYVATRQFRRRAKRRTTAAA